MKEKSPYLLPIGFRAFSARAGLYPSAGRLDTAIFISDVPCSAAAVFTTNVVKAAPVLLSSKVIRSGRARMIVANSGCANACTGARGMKDAKEISRFAAQAMGVPESETLNASTGVIGKFLPLPKLKTAIRKISTDARQFTDFDPVRAARAIMTTDTRPKVAGTTINLGGEQVTIWGCAKGAGMIHPNMATMLSFIFTDALIAPAAMRSMLKRAADHSFNQLSVDGDTSTNDTVFFLANGRSGAILKGRSDLAKFEQELTRVSRSLAEQIAADGEGATSRIDIDVKGVKNDADARKIAFTIATSPLVKTAVFGRDANWGRILAAAGRSGAQFDPNRAEVRFGKLCVCKFGGARPFSEAKARKILSAKIVPITVDLHQGKGQARYVTCDFSIDYVKINADYRT